MVLEALEWGMGCPFADKGHDLAARGMPLYVSRKGAGKAFGSVSLAVRCHLFAACCRRNAISLFALLALGYRLFAAHCCASCPLKIAVGAQIAVCAYGSAGYGEDGCIASVFFFQGVAQVVAVRKAAKPYEILPSPAFPHQFQPTFF